jgi:LPS-assembly protein
VPGWSFNANINRVSDNTYFEDFGNSLTMAATSLLGSSAYINGGGQWWNAAFGVDTYQLTDPTLPQGVQPYSRLPRGVLDLDIPLSGPFIFGLRSEAVAFRKHDALEGDRLDLYPYLEAPLQGAAWFLRPRLGFRYTQYWLQGNHGDPSRALPIAQIDSGLIFDRQVSLFGNSYTQTLEPRAYYLYVPYRNQDNLPIFDTAPLTFDWWSLFSSNQYTGADRQVNANNLTLALSTRLIDSSGIERFAAGIGQIRYFTPQRVQLPGYATLYQAGSAYVGMLSLGLTRDWKLDLTQQYDPNLHRTTVSSLQIQHRLNGDGVLNLSYRYQRGLLDQYDLSALWPVSPSWSLVGRWNYSVADHKTLEAFGGVEWDSCCVAVRGVLRRYVTDSQGNSTNAVMVEVVFKGIGGLGSRTGNFLSHAILGYQ